MKLSIFLAAALASLCSTSVARPVDFSGDLQSRDAGELQLSEVYNRGLDDWESLDLYTRDFAEFDDLDVRGYDDELDARGPAKTAPAKTAPAKAPPAKAPPAKADPAKADPATSTKKKLAKPKLAKPAQCRKRDGPCLNLYVVWYSPIGNSARHWALFLSSAANAAAVSAASGTIYQVVDHREFPHLTPQKLDNMQPARAGRYEGSKLLVGISKASMDEYYVAFKDYLLEEIGDHNKDKKNIMCQSNCQHWVKELAAQVGGTDFSGVPM